MVTQLNSANRGVITDEMKKVAQDEQVDISFILKNVANGSIIIPKNIARKQQIKPTGIGRGLKTKVNVNIGTPMLYRNIEDGISKAKVAVKYGADTIMNISDECDLNLIREKLLDASSTVTFGSVPIYQTYGYGLKNIKTL